MNLHRFSPAAVVIVSGIVAAMHIGKIPPAIPLLRDALGVSLVEAGFLLSLVQVAGMLSGVFVGLAADGVGMRRSVVAGQAILALASLAALWAQHPADLLLLRALEGCGFLLAVLPVPGLIRQLVPPPQLALHLGLWGAYMPAGASLALLFGPPVMAGFGWSSLWAALAVLSFLTAFALLVSVPSDRQRRVAAPVAAVSEHWRERLLTTLTASGPWRIAISFAMYSCQWLAVIGFLPSIYAQAGVNGQVAGALTALACFANVVGNVAAGRLLHGGFAARTLLYAGFAGMAGAALLAFSPASADLPVLRFLAVVGFSAVGGLIPGTLFSLAVHVAPNERTVSTTVGWMQQCSSFGQFAGPPLVAWIAAVAGGWQWTGVFCGAAALVGLLLARGLERRH
ncbi:MFS transporter [Rhodocyclus tenuis]|uniref:MFS family permease n=1 Tax=Rhodocyclus tenuis TaxID=1066 RepID=A0A840FW67_RHOTE|nr:MFS transporter [Rhodocyclus tenuis]MBB4246337.1 MFS family permease [Rhodocyclus tenuis]